MMYFPSLSAVASRWCRNVLDMIGWKTETKSREEIQTKSEGEQILTSQLNVKWLISHSHTANGEIIRHNCQ